MSQVIRALVAVDQGVDLGLVQAALPTNQAEIQLVGVVDGLDEGWSTLQETPTDLLVIACAGSSDRVLFLIDGAFLWVRIAMTPGLVSASEVSISLIVPRATEDKTIAA